jgi:hypothetical protein
MTDATAGGRLCYQQLPPLLETPSVVSIEVDGTSSRLMLPTAPAVAATVSRRGYKPRPPLLQKWTIESADAPDDARCCKCQWVALQTLAVVAIKVDHRCYKVGRRRLLPRSSGGAWLALLPRGECAAATGGRCCYHRLRRCCHPRPALLPTFWAVVLQGCYH